MTTLRRQQHLLILALLLVLATTATEAGTVSRLSGRVADHEHNPIPGATVIVLSEGKIVAGSASDDDGNFAVSFSPVDKSFLKTRVSSVGYAERHSELPPDQDCLSLELKLQPQVVEVPGMTISPTATPEDGRVDLPKARIARRARMSLVATNPTAAIKEPEVSRSGSSHSSQLRVHGTNPVYYLNGLPIGTDPAHYGMFCFIPASVVEEIKFQALGSDAKFRLPSVIQFESATPFGQRSGGDINVSTIDVTGTLALGGERWYALGSIRKSVLDRLVETLQGNSDRTTLPPTNFQDVFGSAGFDLGRNIRLMVDQYGVRDYLKYNTSTVTGESNGTVTVQESREDYLGVRLQALFGNVLLKANGGMVNERHEYHATPEREVEGAAHLYADIHENREVGFGSLDADIDLERTRVKFGVQSENRIRGEYSVNQCNWNFLPPFSNTDNLYVYQGALNQTYADQSGDLRGWNHAAYISVSETVDRVTLTGGARLDTYAHLAGGGEYSYRLRAAWRAGDRTRVELFNGTFSESPVGDILQPYQVLIRSNLKRLRPILTDLWSLGITSGPVRVNVFNKHITQLPVPTPNFVQPLSESGTVSDDFIGVTSTGEARFWGGSISLTEPYSLSNRLSIYASYTYTRAHQIDHGVETRYTLDAPHRAQVQADFRLAPNLSVGAEIQVRSGYPYSPLRTNYAQDESQLYTSNYYYKVLEQENSQRFPTHAYLNLNAEYRFGRTEIFMLLSNVTDRANPIVNAASGLIYDAGIAPMLGMRVAF